MSLDRYVRVFNYLLNHSHAKLLQYLCTDRMYWVHQSAHRSVNNRRFMFWVRNSNNLTNINQVEAPNITPLSEILSS